MPSRIVRLGWRLLNPLLIRWRPTDQQLQTLSERDRPGLTIELPSVGSVTEMLRIGRAQLASQQLDQACSSFREALTLNPNNPWAWHGLGDALQLNADYKEALAAYERAIELQPRQGLHHGGHANALRALNRTTEAKASQSRALSLDPTLADIFNWRQDA